MSAYMIDANAYQTILSIFRAEYIELNMLDLFLDRRIQLTNKKEYIPLNSRDNITMFVVQEMVIANSKNLMKLYPKSCQKEEIITEEKQAREYIKSGKVNQEWLKLAKENKQLLVKAINWWQYQTCDYESEAVIYQFMDELVKTYAVNLVRNMPGTWYIPRIGEKIEM